MNLFNTIRSIFGLRVDVDDTQPIDQLEQLTSELSEKRAELVKAQREFDEINYELNLKIMACDKLIEKGVKEGEFNKTAIKQRLDRITDEFLTNVQGLSGEIRQLEEQGATLGGDILSKAIDLTSRLTQSEQQEINDIIVTWRETGLIKGEQVNSQMRAIVTALDEIVKGGEGSRGGKVIGRTKSGKPIYDTHSHEGHKDFSADDHKEARSIHEKKAMKHYDTLHTAGAPVNKRKSAGQKHRYHMDQANAHAQKHFDQTKDLQKSHEPLAIELAGKGDVEYDSPVAGHYANVIVKDKDGKILFLKRASDKAVAPNQYCLPGGHIDEGETIEQAACRELKEEANIECDYCHVIGKAKCEDGKWAFYLNAYTNFNDVALLDGESVNAHWMSRDEWIEVDLIFDLKDHLVAMETKTSRIEDIPDIMKGEDDDELEKGGFHPEKPNHKYVRREGSPGNYTYFYDSPDTKERDGKKYREGLYSSNVAPKESHQEDTSDLKELVIVAKKEYDKYQTEFLKQDSPSKAFMQRFEEVQSNYEDLLQTYKDRIKKDDNDLEKAIDIDNPFYYDNEDDIIKGKAAQDGEERTWGGKTYKKQGKEWKLVGTGKKKGEGKEGDKDSVPKIGSTVTLKSDSDMPTSLSGLKGQKLKVTEHQNGTSSVPVYLTVRDESGEEHTINPNYVNKEGSGEKKQKPLSTKQLKEHVENTSTDQLKKVAKDDKHPHNDAAKRELERRGETKKEEEFLQNNKIFLSVMSSMIDKRTLKAEQAVKGIAEEFGVDESTVRKGLKLKQKE